jgi:hypothetical protein
LNGNSLANFKTLCNGTQAVIIIEGVALIGGCISALTALGCLVKRKCFRRSH